MAISFLGACAGNPPAWWNPNNRYGAAEQTSALTTPKKQVSQDNRSVVVTEENIDPILDDSYEEITLTPMPDEDRENATGVAASQNEELLPDGVLPVPSVLN